MKVGSLFSGIGGLDLGLERAGFEVRWQVENDDPDDTPDEATPRGTKGVFLIWL